VLVPAVGLAVEEFLRWGFGCEGEGGQRVHYEVYPEHLDGGEDLLLYKGGPDESHQHGDHVDGELELDELADRIEDVAAPEYCLDDGIEVVVQEDDGSCLAGHFRAGYAHREPHVCLLEGGSVVGAVTGGRHNFSSFL
jgi:hypothetical protein